MGRTKNAGVSSGQGSGSRQPSPAKFSNHSSTMSPAGKQINSSHNAADVKVKDLLRELHQLIRDVQSEREKSEPNLANIAKTHEKMQQEGRASQYYKTKLKTLYSAAYQDTEIEANILQKALEKIAEIKTARDSCNGDRPRPIMRRGVLMSMLQQSAMTLPLWIGKHGEKPPPLCGAVQADANYVCKPTDTVAARVKSSEGEENWILAEVVSYNAVTGKYEVDDIDAEEGKERHTLSKRRVVPLARWRANPDTDPEALFPKHTLVLALYPQTTCFYRALIHKIPTGPQDDYSVLFEDTSYSEGYSPPLGVAQRYVIVCRDEKKK